MQFKFSAFILAALCGSAVNSAALPETDGAAPSHFDTDAIPLESRALVKLNQYRTLDDCNHDRNILYHAAPVSGRCYPLDRATGAFFLNTGGFFYCRAKTDSNCGGGSRGFPNYSGACYARDNWNGVTCS
ncbi:hypothetical protein AAL_02478 [Moelleriella libera RCEF 2490]|uniref:Uncharacterized protein n=1 Tax=Moelleriella libera RCEF 2490 TaxID=1081109 RepID=A0A168ELM1_9HYPO|nr:hypothetical protein AAL_02478 [Moelleriella libera RCEF 2490]